MSCTPVLALMALSQLSLSMRPSKLDLKPEVAGEDVPEGWAEVLVPLGEGEDLEHLGRAGKSHSQVGQDQLVQSILECKKGGFFLDLASNDAVKYSNTLMLERDYGWNGICLEANPQYMLGLSKRRNCKVVLAAVGDGSEQTFAFRGIFGGIVSDDFDNSPDAKDVQTTTMRTTPLRQLLTDLEAPKTIDYLSLDVEGAEYFVMQDFPFDEHKISVITVERPQEELVALLKKNGYHYLRRNSKFNDITWVDDDTYTAVNGSDRRGWAAWEQVEDEDFHKICAPFRAA